MGVRIPLQLFVMISDILHVTICLFYKISIMSKEAVELEKKLVDSELQDSKEFETVKPIVIEKFEYKEFGKQPKVNLKGLPLLVLCPLLLGLHVQAARFMEIPMIQYLFLAVLVAFVINYLGILRKYELMPYLPEQVYDKQLKLNCIAAVIALLISTLIGWNGSGGMIFAILWVRNRGERIGSDIYLYVVIIIGSLLMEDHYDIWKLVEFIPGLIYGIVSSEIYKLGKSSYYCIAHQFLLLSTIVIPIFFPSSSMIVPNLWQWGVMIISGVTLLFTLIHLIHLMQSQRTHLLVGIVSGVLMLATQPFYSFIDYAGAILIVVGVAILLKRTHIDIPS